MKRVKRQRQSQAQGAGEFALSSHQLTSAAKPRASIRTVLALKPEQRADTDD